MAADTLREARRWLRLGVAPIPILAHDKRPARPWLQYQSELPSLADLHAWFGNGDLNLAIVCGWKRLLTLDFDSLTAWREWLDWLERERPGMQPRALAARQTKTARGRHLYVRLSQTVRTRPLRSLGIDVKAAGGYVLVPPSVHPTGAVYRFADPDAPILSCDSLSDVLPASALVAAVVEDSAPAGVVLPAVAVVLADADPWTSATHAIEFDRARGLARIKAGFRVEEFFPVRRSSSGDGRWWLTTCPWHDDKNPSFWIDTTRQLCGCHAGCTPKPLDVIDLFARVCGLSNDESIRQMSRMLDGR